MSDVQFIWWFPEWKGFGRYCWNDRSHGMFLNYSILIGYLEIRVWHKGKRP